jgi:hypothetical protein
VSQGLDTRGDVFNVLGVAEQVQLYPRRFVGELLHRLRHSRAALKSQKCPPKALHYGCQLLQVHIVGNAQRLVHRSGASRIGLEMQDLVAHFCVRRADVIGVP